MFPFFSSNGASIVKLTRLCSGPCARTGIAEIEISKTDASANLRKVMTTSCADICHCELLGVAAPRLDNARSEPHRLHRLRTGRKGPGSAKQRTSATFIASDGRTHLQPNHTGFQC